MNNMPEQESTEKQQRREQLLKEGKMRFLEELHRHIQKMEQLLCQVESSDAHEELPGHIYRHAHTLKGSGPVFGFPSVGEVAGKLVSEWEWTQEEGMEPDVADYLAKRAVPCSRPILMQLKMELLILQRQLQLSEQQEQGKPAMVRQAGKLLLVDDDEVLRSFLVRRLELDGYVVHEADSVAKAKQLLHAEPYDLILLDLMMHPQSGYELFDYLKEDPTLQWVPLIVLSARSDVHDKVRCLMLGANDYVTKPFEYDELAARLYSLLSRTRNFEKLAFRDPLTGMFNRRYFDHQIERELQRIDRYPAPLSIAFIDIDHFKRINDTYGHAAGDLVLQGLAHVVQQRLRATDFLARYGGEEFVAVLPNTTGEQAARLMDGILQSIRNGPIARHDGRPLAITFSCGIAEWQPGWSATEWIELADEAMYRAKQLGRDRILLAEADSRKLSTEVRDMGGRLKRVLIADDDAILRSLLAAWLRKMSVEVIEATDGEEAYRILRSEAIDVCILDGVMPKMDGFELLKRLKAEPDESGRKRRILMLSGKKREEDITLALRLGADEYMSKPFSLVELESRISKLLDMSSA